MVFFIKVNIILHLLRIAGHLIKQALSFIIID